MPPRRAPWQRASLSELERVRVWAERTAELEKPGGSPASVPTEGLETAADVARAEMAAGRPHAPGKSRLIVRKPFPGTDEHDEVLAQDGVWTVTRYVNGIQTDYSQTFKPNAQLLRTDFDPTGRRRG